MLDGVRGLAILLVIVLHTTRINPTIWLDRWYVVLSRSGWIGVDLFFVLSGFLITGILADTRNNQHRFRNFYARRTLRIFPLYYAVVALAVFVLPEFHFRGAQRMPDPGPQQWWFWLYLSNFLSAQTSRVGHVLIGPAWSLAIEEQFYLLWPLLVLTLSRTAMLRICFASVLCAYYLRHGMLDVGYHPMTVYVFTFTRFDALAAGAWLALAARGPGGLRALFPFALGFWMISAAALSVFLLNGWVRHTNPNMIRYGYSIATVFFTSSLYFLLIAHEGSLLARVFSARALRLLGKYSYAMYLFNWALTWVVHDYMFRPGHIPLLAGSKLGGQLLFTAAVTAVSLACAWISWHVLEKHFLALKRFFPSRAQNVSESTEATFTTPPIGHAIPATPHQTQ